MMNLACRRLGVAGWVIADLSRVTGRRFDLGKSLLSYARSCRGTPKTHQRSFFSRDTSEWNIERVAKYVVEKPCKRVVVMAGAGISSPSGIPDFRSPGTGLYDNLQKYQLPYPEAIFDIDYFFLNPKPFFALAKELYPGNYRPNYAHYFVRLLQEKGKLLRMYTQNIDALERIAGISAEKLVEAHGSFATATCKVCFEKYTEADLKEDIFKDKIPKCQKCQGIVKPDIIFFGEELPMRFFSFAKDFPLADLVIVMGTSLEVHPFAGIVDCSLPKVPRVLFNQVAVGPFESAATRRSADVAVEGDIVENIQRFVQLLGWQDELENIIKQNEVSK